MMGLIKYRQRDMWVCATRIEYLQSPPCMAGSMAVGGQNVTRQHVEFTGIGWATEPTI